jgi:hypothetical protein
VWKGASTADEREEQAQKHFTTAAILCTEQEVVMTSANGLSTAGTTSVVEMMSYKRSQRGGESVQKTSRRSRPEKALDNGSNAL